MTPDGVQRYAAEVLGLALDATQGESVAVALTLLREWTLETESVALPYLEEPFTSPALGDQWLKRY